MKLNSELLPHRQERSFTCLPACLRVVLYYHGRDYPEADLAALCGTRRWGTDPEAVTSALLHMGCDFVRLEGAALEQAAAYLSEDLPVIAYLRLDALHHGITSSHCVVVAEIGEGRVRFLDPSTGSVTCLDRQAFSAAWEAHGGDGVVIVDTEAP
jgi:ABC-type bacteriocin/lantibiotic exporter with double-glycine peptidase domain